MVLPTVMPTLAPELSSPDLDVSIVVVLLVGSVVIVFVTRLISTLAMGKGARSLPVKGLTGRGVAIPECAVILLVGSDPRSPVKGTTGRGVAVPKCAVVLLVGSDPRTVVNSGISEAGIAWGGRCRHCDGIVQCENGAVIVRTVVT